MRTEAMQGREVARYISTSAGRFAVTGYSHLRYTDEELRDRGILLLASKLELPPSSSTEQLLKIALKGA